MHSDRPKLYTILAYLSAVGLIISQLFLYTEVRGTFPAQISSPYYRQKLAVSHVQCVGKWKNKLPNDDVSFEYMASECPLKIYSKRY